MTTDIQILPMKEGEFNMEVLGAADDSGLMILQRVFTLLLSTDDAYREGAAGNTLLSFMQGGNYPEEGIMNSYIAACCGAVLTQMDADDRDRIESLSGLFQDGKIECTLEFTDGTTLTGVIDV